MLGPLWLSDRQRELVLLVLAHEIDAAYERHQHVRIGLLEVPVPDIDPHEMRVDVRATALDRQDLLAVRELDHYITEYPLWGGGDTRVPSIRCLGSGSRFITSGAIAVPNHPIEIGLVFVRQLEIRGSTSHGHTDFAETLRKVWSGDIGPVIQEALPLEEYVAAFEKMANHDLYGKIVPTQQLLASGTGASRKF